MPRSKVLICALMATLLSISTSADELTKMIQEDLAALGYDIGSVDGEMNSSTVVAVSQFQAENDLEVTGQATPQLAGVIKAKLDASAVAASTPASQPIDSAALQAAQQACLKEKVETAQASQKKKRGFGSLMRAVTNTAVRFGGGSDLARQVSETSYDIYNVNATADDWERAAKDLGLTQNELEECRNPAGVSTMNAGVGDNSTQPQGTTQQLTPEQRQALEQSGMGGMFESMMGGANSGEPSAAPQPDRNIAPADTYSFSHRITMRITTNRGTVEPIYYASLDAPYYARSESGDGQIEFLVYDNDRNLVALFREKNGNRGLAYNRMSLETKAKLTATYRDAPQKAPVKSLGTKKILGYDSEGYEIPTLAGTTEIWVTDDAPASLFGMMFENRTDSNGEAGFGKNSMVMEISFTSARTPEDNYRVVCTDVRPDALTLRAADYQST